MREHLLYQYKEVRDSLQNKHVMGLFPCHLSTNLFIFCRSIALLISKLCVFHIEEELEEVDMTDDSGIAERDKING